MCILYTKYYNPSLSDNIEGLLKIIMCIVSIFYLFFIFMFFLWKIFTWGQQNKQTKLKNILSQVSDYNF